MKKIPMVLCLAAALVAGSLTTLAAEEMSWTGEVLDLACYVGQGARGADHAGCAKTCVKSGQPMGLLTDDGTLVLLAADHKNGEPYEALKDMAGSEAVVMGTLAEKDGMKVVTVSGAKAAG